MGKTGIILIIVVGWCIMSIPAGYSGDEPAIVTDIANSLYFRSYPTKDVSFVVEEELVFANFMNGVYTVPFKSDDQTQQLREEWDYFLGFDIFYSYFKMKEIEDWVKDTGKVKIFNIQGKPEFGKDSLQYIFNKNF
ncbi:MAG: hypothetical protein JXD21_03980 [Candidatus Omnitrophica bacterium]|nr:hypothetical protein [Candidatus Omnitrophota bacterium]